MVSDGATAAGAGIVCPWGSPVEDPAYYALLAHGARYYPRLVEMLAEDGEHDLGYARVGGLYITSDPADLEIVERRARERAANAPEAGQIQRLSPADARDLFPPLRPDQPALYVSGGDGASWQFADYGQEENPAGDPPVPAGGLQTPPTAEGGALRSQDQRLDAIERRAVQRGRRDLGLPAPRRDAGLDLGVQQVARNLHDHRAAAPRVGGAVGLEQEFRHALRARHRHHFLGHRQEQRVLVDLLERVLAEVGRAR